MVVGFKQLEGLIYAHKTSVFRCLYQTRKVSGHVYVCIKGINLPLYLPLVWKLSCSSYIPSNLIIQQSEICNQLCHE
jgi:hypothetical protein